MATYSQPITFVTLWVLASRKVVVGLRDLAFRHGFVASFFLLLVYSDMIFQVSSSGNRIDNYSWKAF